MIWAYNSSSSSSFEFALKVDQTCETASFMLLYSKGMVYLYCSAFLNQKQTFSKKDGHCFWSASSFRLFWICSGELMGVYGMSSYERTALLKSLTE